MMLPDSKNQLLLAILSVALVALVMMFAVALVRTQNELGSITYRLRTHTIEMDNMIQRLLLKIKRSNDQAVPVGSDTSTPAPSEIEGWKTYRNEKYGFEVRYPPDLMENVTDTSGTRSDIPLFLRIVDMNYIPKQDTVGQVVRSEQRLVELQVFRSSAALLRDRQERATQYPDRFYMSIGDTQATAYTRKTAAGPYFIVFFLKDNYLFEWSSFDAHKELTKNILSTFKFIE